MKALRSKIETILKFLSFEVWFTPTKEMPFWKRLGMELYKVLAVTFKKAKTDGIIERSSALSYYSMLAVVPILAMLFGLAGGFGLEGPLLKFFARDTVSNSLFWTNVIDFSKNMLQKTNAGLIGGIGVILLFWIIINVLTRVELALNTVWEIRKPRTMLRKATDYVTIVVLTPMLAFTAISAQAYVSDNLTQLVDITIFQSIVRYILALTPLLSGIVLICLVYIILPNRRMPLLPTLISGIITGIVFVFVQSLYVKLQVYMTTYNVVYGSFAALPLFLIWLRICWVILLSGAELGFSIYSRSQYIFESDYKYLSGFRRKIYALQMLNLLVKQFEGKGGGMSVQTLSEKIGAPKPYIMKIAQELTETGILNCIFVNDYKYTYQAEYQPAFDTHKMRVCDVLQALDRFDYNEEFKPKNNATYKYFEEYMKRFEAMMSESEENILIRDLKF